MRLDFSGKTAVVTGGANGIGLTAARLLRSSGARVWIFDLPSERPQEVALSFTAHGAEVDVTNRSSLEEGFTRAGDLDILIASAGTVRLNPVLANKAEDWEHVLAVNLTGVYHSVQLAAVRMKERRRGVIILTASTNSIDGEAQLIAYNAAAAGLLGILRTAANELGPYQIRVNAVCPGLIQTRQTQPAFEDRKFLRDYFRHIPLGRGGTPEEVANAIVFLASDEASYITGATLMVDGGQTAAKFGTWREEEADFFGDRWWLR